MPYTLLLDLDDTLLDTNLESFLPAYYGALARHLSPLVEPNLMLDALKTGVRAMHLNRDPLLTLQKVFEAVFYPALPRDRLALEESIWTFYREVFPTLKDSTHPREGVPEMVEWAASRGHRLAVATDPVLPLVANLERLRWAGLDPQAFQLVTSFETFHFTKSHAAFFAETAGRLGWPEGPILMAGDHVERDLVPAESLGFAVFHVTGDGTAGDRSSGGTADLRRWIEARESDADPAFGRTRDGALAMLEATPAVLQTLTAGLSAAEWAHEPSADDWAIIELVCHLRDTEREVHALQVTALLESESPFVARPDAAVWAKQRRYLDEDGRRAIKDLAEARLANLDRLRAAPAEAWAKPARHAIFGPTTFQEVVGFMAEHDRLHIQQAWRTLYGENQAAHPN